MTRQYQLEQERTKVSSHQFTLYGYLLLFILCSLFAISACSQPETQDLVVTEVVVVEGEELVVTRVVRQTIPVTATADATAEAEEPIELDISFIGELPDIDPQQTDSAEGTDLVENLFVGLTNYNHKTNQVEPELAQSWEVSDDGRTWTFHLRDDIFWIRAAETDSRRTRMWDVEPVRPVLAGDMVYAIQRICGRETQTPDAFILFLIQGCQRAYEATSVTAADLNRIGVRAIDDFTLQISLAKPAGYFLSITSMSLFHPVSGEVVEAFEGEWQTAENLLTSGPFFPLPEGLSEARMVLHRNPLWPIPYQGNVDIINLLFLEEADDAFKLWEANSLDMSPLPADQREEIISRDALKTELITEQAVFYLSFNFDSAVFREAEMRRAFSAAIDRERLVEELFGGRAMAMPHLTPPGVIGAPPLDGSVGLGFSPGDAEQEMATSGFRSCRLIPQNITFMISPSDLSLQRAELLIDMWVENLGCDESQFEIQQVQFGTLLASTRPDAGAARPDIWELAWASYYPDAHNWVGDLLHCQESENRQNRPCSEVDELIRRAATTADLQERTSLYTEIENLFFGREGIAPIVPLYMSGEYRLVQSWLIDYTPVLFGGEQYDTYQIDANRKELERNR